MHQALYFWVPAACRALNSSSSLPIPNTRPAIYADCAAQKALEYRYDTKAEVGERVQLCVSYHIWPCIVIYYFIYVMFYYFRYQTVIISCIVFYILYLVCNMIYVNKKISHYEWLLMMLWKMRHTRSCTAVMYNVVSVILHMERIVSKMTSYHVFLCMIIIWCSVSCDWMKF